MLCNNDEDPVKEQRYLHLIRDENLAGIILSPTRQTADDFSATVELNIPMVVIDRRVSNEEVDNVIIDNIAFNLIVELDEILIKYPKWHNGYNGLLQLFIVYYMFMKMKLENC